MKCSKIWNNENLKSGENILGHLQGGNFEFKNDVYNDAEKFSKKKRPET